LGIPSEKELRDAIADAVRAATLELFREHPGHYYYVSVITTGEAHAPMLTAWSKEALEEAVAEGADAEEARLELRWSYADSPYCGFGDAYFGRVRELFALRPRMDPEDDVAWSNEFNLRLRAMEAAVAVLDSEGLYGRGTSRLGIVVGVEVMPPDGTNLARMRRLNPPAALGDWLAEAAEE
jgi:hypothetical protein